MPVIRITDPERLATLAANCRVASRLAASKGRLGQESFLASVLSMAEKGIATEAQEARVAEQLAELKGASAHSPDRSKVRHGQAARHAKNAPARLPSFSILKGDE